MSPRQKLTPQVKAKLRSTLRESDLAGLTATERETAVLYFRLLRTRLNAAVKEKNREYFRQNAPPEVELYPTAKRQAEVGKFGERFFGPLDDAMADAATVRRFRTGSIQDRSAIQDPIHNAIRESNLGLLISCAALGGNNTKPMIEYRDTPEANDLRFLTYGQVDEYTNRLAHGFAKVGVQKGSHVAVVTEGAPPETMLSIIALRKLGAVTVMMDSRDDKAMLTHELVASDAEFVVAQCVGDSGKMRNLADAAVDAAAEKGKGNVKVFVSATSSDLRTHPPNKFEPIEGVESTTLGELTEGCPATEFVDEMVKQKPEDNAFLLFTSGTTGGKKPVILTNENFMCMLANNVLAFGRRGMNLPVQFTQGHLMGLYAPYMAVLDAVKTGDSKITSYPTAQSLRDHEIDYVERGFDTVFAVPDFLMWGITNRGNLQNEVKAALSLSRVMSGSARLTSSLREEFNSTFYTTVINRLGMTEAGLCAIEMQPASNKEEYSVGQPIIPLGIHDNRHRMIKPTSTGRLVWSGPTVSPGYYISDKLPPAYRKAIEESNKKSFYTEAGVRHFVSGDEGYLDDSGRLRLVARTPSFVLKDSKGEQIDIVHIEGQLTKHPDIKTAVVIPRMQKGLPFDFKVVCAPKQERVGTPEDMGKLREELSLVDRHLSPSSFEFRRYTHFPKTPTATVDRQALIAQDHEKLQAERLIEDELAKLGVLITDIDEKRLPPGLKGLSKTLDAMGLGPTDHALRISQLADIVLRRPWIIGQAKSWWLSDFPQGEGFFEDNLIGIYAARSLKLKNDDARKLQAALKVD